MFVARCKEDPRLLQYCTETMEKSNGEVELLNISLVDNSNSMATSSSDIRSIAPDRFRQNGVSCQTSIEESECGLSANSSFSRSPTVTQCRTDVTSGSCSKGCFCKCYQHTTVFPRIVSSKLYSPFTPYFVRKCSKPTCWTSRNRFKPIPTLSLGLLKRAAGLVMMLRCLSTKHHIKTYRIIPEGSDSMQYAKHGQLQALKSLIERGSAMIDDMAPDGRAACSGQVSL